MEWSKVDPALAAALSGSAGHELGGEGGGDGGARRIPVFVYVDAAQCDRSVLRALDLRGADGPVRTGTVTAADVERLTDQPWVRRVVLSGPLRLAGP